VTSQSNALTRCKGPTSCGTNENSAIKLFIQTRRSSNYQKNERCYVPRVQRFSIALVSIGGCACERFNTYARDCKIAVNRSTSYHKIARYLAFLSFFVIAVASPPDRRVTRDDIGVASAGVAASANNAAATGCISSASGASGATASARSRNPSTSPGRNGQLSSKFSRYYPSR